MQQPRQKVAEADSLELQVLDQRREAGEIPATEVEEEKRRKQKLPGARTRAMRAEDQSSRDFGRCGRRPKSHWFLRDMFSCLSGEAARAGSATQRRVAFADMAPRVTNTRIVGEPDPAEAAGKRLSGRGGEMTDGDPSNHQRPSRFRPLVALRDHHSALQGEWNWNGDNKNLCR